ncbi:MAG: chemotaxis protein CheW [Syntrophomonadaceae bacterium]|nr:chemotaxis protein CheW [Syntrophomonadaceae bacterium]
MEKALVTDNEQPVFENEEFQVVAFKLGQEEYAVEILHVQDINRLLNITRIPRSDRHIEGVINLRGNIIPIVNLHTKFNLQASGNEEDKRIIVFQVDELKVGILVDEVSEVLKIERDAVEPTSKVYDSIETEHIKGIAKFEGRLMILLDLLKIFE